MCATLPRRAAFFLSLLCAVLLSLGGNAHAQSRGMLPAAQDLRAEASLAAQRGQPLVLLVGMENCRFCEQIRRDHLRAMSKDTHYVVREVELGNAKPLRNFAGVVESHDAYARSLGAKVAPTVYFLNPRGEQIAEPLIGAGLPDFYGAYLAQRLAQAQQRLRSTQPL